MPSTPPSENPIARSPGPLQSLIDWRRWWLAETGPVLRRGCSDLRRRFPAVLARLWAPFTYAMTATLVSIHVATVMDGGDLAVGMQFSLNASDPHSIVLGDWGRFATQAFAHRDWHHLKANCIWLLAMGIALESRLGTLRVATIYGLGILGSGVFPSLFYIGGAGASGAVYALIGAYLARPTRTRHGRVTISLGWLFVILKLPHSLARGTEMALIGHEAHVAGLFVGLWCGALFRRAPAPDPRWNVRARAAAMAAVLFALSGALVMHPRWTLGWHQGQANRAESREDYDTASQHWSAIESVADPSRPGDLEFLYEAAHRMDWVSEREHLAVVATMMNDADVHREVANYFVDHEPRDEGAALRHWRRALKLNPDMVDALNEMAICLIDSDLDTTRIRFEQARQLAQRAVSLTRARYGEEMRTLALAHQRCGEPRRAVYWMRRASVAWGSNRGERARYRAEADQIERGLKIRATRSSAGS